MFRLSMFRLWMFLGVAALAAGAQAGSFELHVTGPLTTENAVNGHGCNGRNRAPQVVWSDPPSGTRSFALTAYDPDARTGSGWWHWVVVDLPATARSISETPQGAHDIRNDFGRTGWGGPCPPTGDPPHHYVFTIYALDVPTLSLPPDASAAMAGSAIHAHTLGKAQQTLRYGR